jgi:predicted PurR-regulated permease PerM
VLGASFALASGAAALVTLLVLVFFWLTGRSRLQRYALAFVPLHRRAGVREGWNEVETRLGLWVRGQLILMVTIGVAAGIAYALIGVPAAVLLGLIAALAEAIPIVGPLIGAVPAVLLATSVSPETAVLTLAVYAILQFVEGNVVLPIVMRNAVGLSPFLVLVSLLVGFSVGGVLGAIVAVPIVAAFEAVLERLQDREVPVAIEVSGDSVPSEDERDAMGKRAPDSIATPRGAPTRSDDDDPQERPTRRRRPSSRAARRSTG